MRTIIITALAIAGCKTFDAGEYAPPMGTPPGEYLDTGLDAEPEDAEIDCADAPLVNWVNFGEGFLLENCSGCHHSETPNRYGAPEDAVFDTVEEVWEQKASLLYIVASENRRMPPSGGTTEMQRDKLKIWLNCGEPGH